MIKIKIVKLAMGIWFYDVFLFPNFFAVSNVKNLNQLSLAGLLISLGIVYGYIGTSPLYVFKAIVAGQVISSELILGSLSCIFWTLTLQTTLKYVLITLRADNKGEGGILSLFSLVKKKGKWLVIPAIIKYSNYI